LPPKRLFLAFEFRQVVSLNNVRLHDTNIITHWVASSVLCARSGRYLLFLFALMPVVGIERMSAKPLDGEQLPTEPYRSPLLGHARNRLNEVGCAAPLVLFSAALNQNVHRRTLKQVQHARDIKVAVVPQFGDALL